MTIYAYSNNGLSFRAVSNTYSAQIGEILFNQLATPEQLSIAFPNYNEELNKELLLSEAKTALANSNVTIMNYYENSIPVPTTWVDYRNILRTIISSGTGTLPSVPQNP